MSRPQWKNYGPTVDSWLSQQSDWTLKHMDCGDLKSPQPDLDQQNGTLSRIEIAQKLLTLTAPSADPYRYERMLSDLGYDVMQSAVNPREARHLYLPNKDLQAASDQRQRLAWSIYNRALNNMSFHMHGEAQKLLSQSLELDPQCAEAAIAFQVNRLEALFSGSPLPKSSISGSDSLPDAFKALVQKYPDSPAAWYSYGSVLSYVGNGPEAVAAFSRCIEKNPHQSEAYRERAKAFSDMGHLTEALASLDVPVDSLDAEDRYTVCLSRARLAFQLENWAELRKTLMASNNPRLIRDMLSEHSFLLDISLHLEGEPDDKKKQRLSESLVQVQVMRMIEEVYNQVTTDFIINFEQNYPELDSKSLVYQPLTRSPALQTAAEIYSVLGDENKATYFRAIAEDPQLVQSTDTWSKQLLVI